MPKPSINVSQAPPQGPPQTPRSRSNGAAAVRASVTPSLSFGLGFSPSFQFGSPRNINLLNTFSPQRFFQVSNNLNKAVKASKLEENKENVSEKADVFSEMDPAKPQTRFLDSLSSSAKTIDTSHDDSGDMWSSANGNTTSLTSIHEFTPKRHENSTFLTPNKLVQLEDPSLSHKRLNDNIAMESVASKKRKASLLESPSVSVASKIETIASPPRSIRPRLSSVSNRKTSESAEKLWTADLDDILISSYAKYKSFKASKASEPSILRNAQQNKVLSRMILNKTGILRNPKQIASRLFKLTKHNKQKKKKENNPPDAASSVNSTLNEELDELMRTPLNDLINNSAIDGISTQDINAQIDKELDLIFSSPELHNSPFNPTENVLKIELNDFAIEYEVSNLYTHHFTRFNLMKSPHRPASHSSATIKKDLKYNKNDELTKLTLQAFNSRTASVFQVYNELNLNMHKDIEFNSLSSVIAHANPLDLNVGSINSYMKILVSGAGLDPKSSTLITLACASKVYNGDELIFESNDSVNGLHNTRLQKYEVSVPFLRNFWSGFLCYVINGKPDQNIISNLSVVQTLYDTVQPHANDPLNTTVHACFIHRFSGLTNKGETIYELAHCMDGDIKEETESDNETVLADSSPIRSLTSSFGPSPRKLNKGLKLDLSGVRNTMSTGPATAPIYNPRIVQQMTHGPGVLPERSNSSGFITYASTTSLPTYGIASPESTNSVLQMASTTPDGVSPFDTPQLSNGAVGASGYAIAPGSGPVTSTPSKVDRSQMAAKNANIQMQTFNSQQMSTQVHPARAQLMVNTGQGFVPFHSLPPLLQERYQAVNQQFEAQQQAQQVQSQQVQMQTSQAQQMVYPQQSQNLSGPHQVMAQQMPGHNQVHVPMTGIMNTSAISAPTSQTSFVFNKGPARKHDSRDTGTEIKFGPILGYDPSKDTKKMESDKKEAMKQQPKTSMGIRRFPVNTQVSMYQPKHK